LAGSSRSRLRAGRSAERVGRTCHIASRVREGRTRGRHVRLAHQGRDPIRSRPVPGHNGSPVMPKRARRKRARRMTARRVLWGEVQELCGEDLARLSGVWTATPPEALQFLLNRAMSALTAIAVQADDVPFDEYWAYKVDAQGNILAEPNKWAKMEMALRDEVRQISTDMERLGIAKRLAAVEESKAAWVLAAIRSAATDAGLSNDQVRLLGEGIRRHLAEEPVGVPSESAVA
jgi:hypothetical protein